MDGNEEKKEPDRNNNSKNINDETPQNYAGSSISHNVAASNSVNSSSSRKSHQNSRSRQSTSKSKQDSNNSTSRSSTSSLSTKSVENDKIDSQSRARFSIEYSCLKNLSLRLHFRNVVKEKPKRRKKTPTVALEAQKYKERRGIVKPVVVGEGNM